MYFTKKLVQIRRSTISINPQNSCKRLQIGNFDSNRRNVKKKNRPKKPDTPSVTQRKIHWSTRGRGEEIAENPARGFPSRGLIGGSEGWNFPVKTSAISNVRVRRRYMVPRMIRVVTHPLGLPQQKTAPRATPDHPIAWAMQISFSPRVSVLNATPYPILLSVRRIPPSFSFARSVCASLTRSATLSAYIAFYHHPRTPSAVFVPPTGQLRHRRNPSFAASPGSFCRCGLFDIL